MNCKIRSSIDSIDIESPEISTAKSKSFAFRQRLQRVPFLGYNVGWGKHMEYRRGSYSIFDVKYHIIWVAKYRYQILTGDIALRDRELIRQTCLSRDRVIIQGV